MNGFINSLHYVVNLQFHGFWIYISEIFKSDLEKRVNSVCPGLKDIISQRIDNDWMDLLWAYAQKTGNDSNYLMKADDGYMCLFNNIFRLEMFRRGIETQKKRNPSIEEIITDKDAIEGIMSIFDMMSDIQKRPGGIDQFWKELFCFSDDILGDDYLIRLFWQQSQNRKPVFYLLYTCCSIRIRIKKPT